MAELILGAVAFGVGVPGAIVAFVECGGYIKKKVDSFRNAPAIVQDMGRFGHDLNQGKLKINIELAEWAYSLDDVDSSTKDAIEDLINKLRSLLQEVDYTLQKLFDRSGQIRRTYFTLLGERKAQQVVKSLKNWQHDFFNIISLIEMRRRVAPRDMHLDRRKYRQKQCEEITDNGELLVGKAEILRGGEATDINVLVERKQAYHDDLRSDMKDIAGILARNPYKNPSGGGVLECLGYREERDAIELIFRLPELRIRPHSLRDLILADNETKSFRGHPLDYKIRLARQLCDTVLAVFTSGLVHKSIRTDTILLLRERSDNSRGFSSDNSSGVGNPYLTSWSLLRKATGLTSGAGSGGYTDEFYRHPKRQGIQPEQRYNIGHDIYSLGVCLLEISLWETFFTRDKQPSRLYRETALGLGLIKDEKNISVYQWVTPWIVPRVLQAIAKNEVPQRTGLGMSRLIISCLTSLEGGMGDPECFKRNTSEAAVRFNEIVSQSFSIIGIQ
jgi:hypothetical protein